MRSKASITKKAEDYGYREEIAKKIGAARANYEKGERPVAKETNRKVAHTKAIEKGERLHDDRKAKKVAHTVVKLGKQMEKHEMKEIKSAHHHHVKKHESKIHEHHKEAKHHMHKLEQHLKKMSHHHEKMAHHSAKAAHHKGHHKAK